MGRYKIPKIVSEFAGDVCFVCKVHLTAASGPTRRTLEHLIPQWMITRFGLLDSTVTLGTFGEIRYMDFLLPCCSECNSHLLAPIERHLSRAFKSWKPKEIPTEVAAKWVAKLVLGTQLYERAATNNRSDESGGEQLSRDYLGELRGQTYVTHRNRWNYPFSVIWLRSKVRLEPSRNFDFQLCPFTQAIYLRCGDISMLARPDAGYIARYGSHIFEPYLDKVLAPLQVEELAAHFFTMAERAKGDHMSSRALSDRPGGPIIVERFDLGHRYPFHGSPDDEVFRYWLTRLTGGSIEELFPSTGGRKTYLESDDGVFFDIPPDAGWH